MPVYANIEPLRWESDFFQLLSGRLMFDAEAPKLTATQLDHYAVTHAKVAADQLVLADALANLGFRLVEGEIDFSLNVASNLLIKASGLRVANERDIPLLREVAAHTFGLSRFRPPWYQPNDSGRFYACWVENAVRGTFDDVCLLLEDNARQPLGWVTLRRLPDHEARIGLLSVWPGRSGQGIGLQLIQSAERWCQQAGIKRLWIATQISNVAAIRLYLRSGANVESTAYWLYR
ncbi:dTDP-4-amino-4,6-dideoxy-D-galactose acyltransferase [Pectobacteriaceae bacterium CE90]|nr:dTDP-4-amino-4,6-dideoxy-D-galactose acyltransferase [Pectobacteriaceae bacterium CE90]